jgi:ABC-type multidrug transport system ATPase subunit
MKNVGAAGSADERIVSLCFQGVDFGYRGQEVLRGVNLSATAGRVYALLGRNGAGKSTIFRLSVGLLRPAAGEVSVFGRPFERAVLRRVGAMIDGPALFPHLSAWQNLRVHAVLLGVPRQRIDEVLQVVGLAGAGRKASRTFSTGMRARLALGIALLDDPDLLLLDEPQNGLDPDGVRELRALIRDLAAAGKTVVISSHILGEVENIADDIGVIADGRLVYQGPLSQFAPDGDLEAAYFAATLGA